MKKNNKGITIMEMIVSMALISIVLGFLLGLLVQLKKIDDKSLKALEYEEKIALIIKYVQDRIADDNSCQFNETPGKLSIKCSDTGRTININNNNNTFTLKDDPDLEKYVFPSGTNISQMTLTTDNNISVASWTITDSEKNSYLLEISYYKK